MLEGFEWDEDKRQSCLDQRGVDFADAAQIFRGRVIEAEDTREDYGEPRFRALGRVDDDCFVVVYTWRAKNRRIISAWKVDDDGKRRYSAILNG